VYHTGQWPTDGVDFTGQRVAVIGTGSSGVQSIPVIARQAQHLTVLQRTAAYCVPARNAPLDTSYMQSVKDNYQEFRRKNRLTRAALGGDTPTGTTGAAVTPEHERRLIFEERWQRGGLVFQGAFNDTLTNRESNELFADFVREKISSIVKNQSTARALMPKNVFGCKRLCVDNGYYETFNRDNVALVDLNEHALEGFTANGVIVGARELPVDAVVFATGFDAMTGALNKISITGRNGQTLREAWSAGPVNYLGLGVNGFPNLFTITGPGSPSVLTNMLVSIQHHVEWITDCLSWLRSNQHATIEVSPTAQDQWVQHVNTVADATLYQSCSSWYLGANVPGKPRVFMPLPGFPAYAQRCADVARKNYLGFLLD
jgi:cyclohexanone monooxygenase